MVRKLPTGGGYKNGARDWSQVFNPRTKQWVKRDSDSDHFMDVNQDDTSIKGAQKDG